ncbi:MAG: hypothetical protein ACYTG0_15865 [Planctomycetota bacterium]|jgi:hypothetical protein
MNRRQFLHVAAATTLAVQGIQPLFAAELRGARRRRRGEKARGIGPTNIFTEPPAIEPITGYLPKFTPVAEGTMRRAFSATYASVLCHGSAARSRNTVDRLASLVVTFSGTTCKTTEVRKGKPSNIVKTELQCGGEFNTVSRWTLDSSIEGIPDAHFTETGTWDGKTMVVKSKSWTQQRSTGKLLIGRWALLPLLGSGKLKSKLLTFDLLDDSTLRPNQILRYMGEIEIPVAGGTAKMDSYAQTGCGIVPTHYLVDSDGRVQLITMTTVNWALTELENESR